MRATVAGAPAVIRTWNGHAWTGPTTAPVGTLRNVASRCAAASYTTSPAHPAGTMVETIHRLAVSVARPVIEWDVTLGYGGENAGGGTYRAAVATSGGRPRPLTFHGDRSVHIGRPAHPGQVVTVTADPAPIIAPAGADLHVWTWVAMDPAAPNTPGDLTGFLPGIDGGVSTGTWSAALGFTQPGTPGAWSMRPSRVIAPSDQAAWIAGGDSIAQQPWAWMERALAELHLPAVKTAQGGEAYMYFPDRWGMRYATHARYADALVDCLGINDTAAPWEVMAARAVAFWRQARAAGIGTIIKPTLNVAPSTSDGWASESGQQVHAHESNRAAFNTWLRGGAPLDAAGAPVAAEGGVHRAPVVTADGTITPGSGEHLVTAVSDAVAAVESAPNSGRYNPAARAAMGDHLDGLHPSPGVHALLGARLARDLRILGY